MTTDLKTDIDLDKELSTWHDRTTADWVRKWNRDNAINWIKELRKLIHPYFAVLTKRDAQVCENLLKKFFDINEEELK